MLLMLIGVMWKQLHLSDSLKMLSNVWLAAVLTLSIDVSCCDDWQLVTCLHQYLQEVPIKYCNVRLHTLPASIHCTGKHVNKA